MPYDPGQGWKKTDESILEPVCSCEPILSPSLIDLLEKTLEEERKKTMTSKKSIMVRFLMTMNRHTVWQNEKKTPLTGYILLEDFIMINRQKHYTNIHMIG